MPIAILHKRRWIARQLRIIQLRSAYEGHGVCDHRQRVRIAHKPSDLLFVKLDISAAF